MTTPQVPRFLRQFAFDAVEGAVTGVILLNIAIPGSLHEAGATALVTGTVITRVAIGAVAAAATRNTPAALVWLRSKLGLDTASA